MILGSVAAMQVLPSFCGVSAGAPARAVYAAAPCTSPRCVSLGKILKKKQPGVQNIFLCGQMLVQAAYELRRARRIRAPLEDMAPARRHLAYWGTSPHVLLRGSSDPLFLATLSLAARCGHRALRPPRAAATALCGGQR